MEDVLEKAKHDNIRFVELQFTDIFGTLKSIEIPVECLADALKRGVWFDGSSIKGFARLKESDMYLMPDTTTYAILPGIDQIKKTARFLCDVYTPEGDLFDGSPRNILKRMIEKAKKKGYLFKVGPEVEFYLFKKKEDGHIMIPESDTGTYFDSPAGDIGSDIRKEVMAALKAFGIDSERAHHEVGAGQHEIGFRYDEPIRTADRVITLKSMIRMIAHSHGLTASFMPKPLYKRAGSGMHVHFSLFDAEGKPLFFDDKDKHKLSPLAKSFIAGQLAHVKEMNAILNPTVNSYKRLVAGYEAPVYICWGSKNRSSLVRIPRYTKGKEASVRAELRCPDPSANPYLVFSVMLAAGLDGIEKNMKLMPELEDNAFEKSIEDLKKMGIGLLPGSLGDAIDALKSSPLMRKALGDELFMKYISSKEKEVEEYRTIVSDWERERYLERC